MYWTGLFHIEMSADIFGRTIQQHCLAGVRGYEMYNTSIHPTLVPRRQCLEMLHIVWMPTRLHRDAPFSHIVPARPKAVGPLKSPITYCGATAIGRCVCSMSKSTLNWVECSVCSQWFHVDCVSVKVDSVRTVDWRCGCQMLKDSSVHME